MANDRGRIVIAILCNRNANPLGMLSSNDCSVIPGVQDDMSSGYFIALMANAAGIRTFDIDSCVFPEIGCINRGVPRSVFQG